MEDEILQRRDTQFQEREKVICVLVTQGNVFDFQMKIRDSKGKL